MVKSIAKQVRSRIEAAGPGSLFLIRDFLDLGPRSNVDVILQRLTQKEMLQRLYSGLYYYPRTCAILNGQPVPPSTDEIAAALARKVGAQVTSSPAKLANELGLSTQVPAKSVYAINGGKARRVKVGNQTIELRPVAPSQFADGDAGPIIQALRYMGEEHITPAMLERLKRVLPTKQKAALGEEWIYAPGWMHPMLRELAESYSTEASID